MEKKKEKKNSKPIQPQKVSWQIAQSHIRLYVDEVVFNSHYFKTAIYLYGLCRGFSSSNSR